MFDTVGRDLDEEFNKRRAQSLLISLLGMGAAVGFVAGVTAYTAAELATDPVDDGDMAPMVLLADDVPEAAPDLPPPPPPPAAAAPEVESDPEVEPDPEPDPDAAPDDLTEPDDVVRDAARPDGVDDGQDGGDPDGEIGGMQGGVKDGTGDHLGGGGPTVFHHSELEVKRRVDPRYPKAAQSMNLGTQRCRARVHIDASGVPHAVDVEDCPKVFHEATREALLKWRWYAPRDGRRKVAAQTVIAVTYQLH